MQQYIKLRKKKFVEEWEQREENDSTSCVSDDSSDSLYSEQTLTERKIWKKGWKALDRGPRTTKEEGLASIEELYQEERNSLKKMTNAKLAEVERWHMERMNQKRRKKEEKEESQKVVEEEEEKEGAIINAILAKENPTPQELQRAGFVL